MKNTKGITLIALVITIIVMLILVTVTVAVVMNEGLFTKAQTAKVGTTKAAEKEKLIELVVEYYDSQTGMVDLDGLGEILPEGWTILNNRVTTSEGNEFYITEEGTVLEETELAETPPPQQDTIAFPMTAQVGENAYATWTNDSTGGKITVTGTGATYDYTSYDFEDITCDQTILGEFIIALRNVNETINSNNLFGIIIMMYALGNFEDATVNDIINMEYIQAAGLSEEQINTLTNLLNQVNKINTIEFSGNITRIGTRFMNEPSEMTEIILTSPDLVEISENSMDEVTFINPIFIPQNVTTIGRGTFNYGSTIKMERANSDGMNLDPSFTISYNISWEQSR